MPPKLDVQSLGRDVSVATFRNVLFCHFRHETPATCVTMLRTAMKALPPDEKVVFFAVIETTSVTPNQEARAAFAKFFEDYAPRFASAVVAICGTGFRAATVRTVASSVLSLLPRFRTAFPKHIVSSIEEAAAHAARSSPELDLTAIAGAFREFSALNPA